MRVLGILNVTEDSFSDGGQFLETDRAIAHAHSLLEQGADVVDIGLASSHPDSKPVSARAQIDRLRPLLNTSIDSAQISIDSPSSEVQRFALDHGVGYLNDIRGFSDPLMYPHLADSSAKLIVMHSVSDAELAKRVHVPANDILGRVVEFFDDRVEQLTSAGISRNRIIIDPGMGFFLGVDPEASLEILRNFHLLQERWELPILISVSRKSFLQKITGQPVNSIKAATLAAELYCVNADVDYIRSHEPLQLRHATSVWQSIKKIGEKS